MNSDKLKVILLFLAIALITGLTVFFIDRNDPSHESFVLVKLGNRTIRAEVADTPEKRARGLSARDELADDEGMLFVFNEPGYHGFWMKEMRFPIDIIWADFSGRIVDIATGVMPETYPQVFKPREQAKYVLELNAGFAADNMIKIGGTMEF
ncbi:MAG: DUF192 domain-containing protein [Candidatus Yanofskybacteria bacterium]|nr:DUF192 domain-containing protein [Candidatus Yanofskybacteria bacterium]